MKINFLHFADYAFLTDTGKIGIVGIFDRIGSKTFPTTHAGMFVVGQVGEIGTEQALTLAITRGNQEIVRMELSPNLQQTKSSLKTYNFLVNITNLVFEDAAVYDFRVLADQNEIGDGKLVVEKIVEAS